MRRVLAPGVFDMFHIGHLNFLQKAAECGDHLTVAVQDGRAAEIQKGKKPVISVSARMAIINALECVDAVISYTDTDQSKLLKTLNIDRLATNESYGLNSRYPDQKLTLQFCKDNDIDVIRFNHTLGVSSTALRSQAKEFWKSRGESGLSPMLSRKDEDTSTTEAKTAHEVMCILRNIPPSLRGGDLLELGCGNGRLLTQLAPHFKRSHGVEWSQELANIAIAAGNSISDTCTVSHADATKFNCESRFDVIVVAGIIVYMEDADVNCLLRNIKNNLLNIMGRVVIREPLALGRAIRVDNQFSVELSSLYSAYYRTREQLQKLMIEQGFRLLNHEVIDQHREDSALIAQTWERL